MSEKKTISGVRTELSPSEFSANLNKVESNKGSKRSKGTFGRINYVLSALGLMPMLTNDSGSKGNRSHGHVHNTPSNFRETYRVDPPPRRTHEDMVREHIAHDAYMDMVDGKGDNER